MPNNALTLDMTRDRMVEMKVTSPFLGSPMHQDLLAVENAPDDLLAAIDEVRERGNEGGGDLGYLLVVHTMALLVNAARDYRLSTK